MRLQVKSGVSSDYPENTMTAFKGAAYQGYDLISINLKVTKDNQIVVLNDNTINRTATNFDGTLIGRDVEIDDITYDEALLYDYGQWFSLKYKGEKLPLLKDVLTIAERNNIKLNINDSFQNFRLYHKALVFEVLNQYSKICTFTVNSVDEAKMIKENLPDCEIHYNGTVNEDVLEKLSVIASQDLLVIWIDFADGKDKLSRTDFDLIKKYARLGIKTLDEYEDYETALEWKTDIVETNGKIKPELRKGIVPDVHIHSEFSLDANFPIRDMRISAKEKGVDIICITDHCDIVYGDKVDVVKIITDSVKASKKENEIKDIDVEVYSGVELGEAIWDMEKAEKVSKIDGLDQIIGSLHAARYPGYTEPYVDVNFSEMTYETIDEFMMTYFDEIIELINTLPFDILAHLTVPMRYINGKYNLNVDTHRYEDKIKKILSLIIQKGIALEVNTSYKGQNYDVYLPEEWIIKMYKEMGGHLVTCNSDAHIPEKVAHCFDEGYEMLKKLGFKYICYFKDRYIYQCTL